MALSTYTAASLPTPSSKQQQCFDCSVLAHDVTGRMVLVESRSVLLISTTTDVVAVIQAVYVSLTRCQHAQMFLSLFHTNPYRCQYRESVQLSDI